MRDDLESLMYTLIFLFVSIVRAVPVADAVLQRGGLPWTGTQDAQGRWHELPSVTYSRDIQRKTELSAICQDCPGATAKSL